MKKEILRALRQVFAISRVTFHEILREKILWSAFMFAILCVGLAYAVSRLSFAEHARISLNFGLTSISIVGSLISVVMGASLIAKEVQNRTLYLVLTKAIWRWQFILGKVLGLLGVLFLNSALMTGIVLSVFVFSGGKISSHIVKSLLLQGMEFGVLASMACIFSAFSTTTLAAVFSSGIWVIGHAMEDFRILTSRMDPPWIRPIMNTVSEILPDLTRFDVKNLVAHQLPLTWEYTLAGVAYGFGYIVFSLVVACLIFSRRDV